MEKQIRHFRGLAFTLIAMAESLKCSAETTLAWRSLQMGRGWLGQALKPYGPSPYTPAERPENSPPTADTEPVSGHLAFDPGVWKFDMDKKAWVFSEDTTTLFRVNFMREKVQEMVDALDANTPQPEKQRKCFENAVQHFQEAKMWYGYQLEQMRNAVPDNAKEVPYSEPLEPVGTKHDPIIPTEEEILEADRLFDEIGVLDFQDKETPFPLTEGDLMPNKPSRPVKKSRKK